MFGTRALVPLTAALTLALPASMAAQQPVAIDTDSIRAFLIHGLEQHKLMDIEFARAIPDSAVRWAPTPEVRDFAEQIEHIIMDNVMFVSRGVLDAPMPTFGDTAAYLNDKAELERVVVATYDWVIESLRGLTAEELVVETDLFRQRLPKWRVYLQALAHADWTRGQLVPYFRLNGITPPGWRSF